MSSFYKIATSILKVFIDHLAHKVDEKVSKNFWRQQEAHDGTIDPKQVANKAILIKFETKVETH